MSARAWRLGPTLLALAAGMAFLIFEPRPGHLAAQTFRAELFRREGFTIWNGQWYGGHHTPAYSVLSPPLAWLAGPRLWRSRPWPARLATGRLPFALGVALGVTLAAPFVIADGRAKLTLEQLRPDELLLRVIRPGDALVRVRFTPYWLAHGGWVERAGNWTKVTARRPGFLRLTTRFSPERIVSRGRRCDGG